MPSIKIADELIGKQKAKDYYDQEAEDYIKQYKEEYDQYPANLIRIKFIIDRLKKNNVKTILDVGCGSCGPMIKLLKEGFDVKGFDFSKEMISLGKKELENAGFNPDIISFVDLEDEKNLPKVSFDAVIALGVFPHIVNEEKALSNMSKMLDQNGLVFIEFRNDLFSAYTLNKYSLDFFLNRVLDLTTFPDSVAEEVVGFYSQRLQVDKPILEKSGKIRYEDILAKFRNPLSIESELFSPCDFSISNLHFYHYHALPPLFEKKYPQLFREESLKLEKTDDKKGYLMASAYVVEARKN